MPASTVPCKPQLPALLFYFHKSLHIMLFGKTSPPKCWFDVCVVEKLLDIFHWAVCIVVVLSGFRTEQQSKHFIEEWSVQILPFANKTCRKQKLESFPIKVETMKSLIYSSWAEMLFWRLIFFQLQVESSIDFFHFLACYQDSTSIRHRLVKLFAMRSSILSAQSTISRAEIWNSVNKQSRFITTRSVRFNIS